MCTSMSNGIGWDGYGMGYQREFCVGAGGEGSLGVWAATSGLVSKQQKSAGYRDCTVWAAAAAAASSAAAAAKQG